MDNFQLNWERHEEIFSFEPKMEKYRLSWDNHQKNISEAFFSLRKDKFFCDVTLACEDRQFQAHKVVLSTGSSFFDQILKSHKHPSPLVYLKGVEAKHVELLLDFMYCGEVALQQEELESFMRAGEELGVRGLAIMVTPATLGPSPKKLKPLQGTGPCEDSSAIVKATSSPDQTIVSGLSPKNTNLEAVRKLDCIMAEAEEDMTNEDCVTLVKSEEMETVTADDSLQGQDHQVPGKWADLEKYVIVKKGRENGGRRSFQCSLCGKVMTKSLTQTMAHVEAKHFRELFTHTCDVCQETFKTKAILMRHIKRIHKAQTV